MSLLSRYYTKETMNRRIIENAIAENEIMDEEAASLYREIAYIKDNIIRTNEAASEAIYGFFGSAGYSL